MMDSKDGGSESLLGLSECGELGSSSKVSLHTKHWGHVHVRWSGGLGNN